MAMIAGHSQLVPYDGLLLYNMETLHQLWAWLTEKALNAAIAPCVHYAEGHRT